MSRAHNTYLSAEQVGAVGRWEFSPVDESSLRFAARVKAQADAEDLLREGALRQAGFEEGFAQGQTQGLLQGQQQLDEYIATQGQEAVHHFANLFAAAQQQIGQAEQIMARGVLELACELARQVLRQELSVNPNVLLPVIHESLGLLAADCKAATVRMHPLDADVMAEPLKTDFPALQLTVVSDSSMNRGGCVVESAGTVIDGTVQKRWSRAVASLGLDSAWEQEP